MKPNQEKKLKDILNFICYYFLLLMEKIKSIITKENKNEYKSNKKNENEEGDISWDSFSDMMNKLPQWGAQKRRKPTKDKDILKQFNDTEEQKSFIAKIESLKGLSAELTIDNSRGIATLIVSPAIEDRKIAKFEKIQMHTGNSILVEKEERLKALIPKCGKVLLDFIKKKKFQKDFLMLPVLIMFFPRLNNWLNISRTPKSILVLVEKSPREPCLRGDQGSEKH